MAPKQKRKHEDLTTGNPADLAQSADEEEPLPTFNPRKKAFDIFKNSVAEPVAPAKFASGGAPTCSIEGVVLRTKKIMVQQKGTQVPKLQLTVATMKLNANGCKDVINTGIDGVAFQIPTKTLEPSPEEVAKNKDAKGATVLDVQDGFSAASYLGIISASFYTEPPGTTSTKGGDAIPVDQCVPGTRVLISNITSVHSKDGRIFCNAKKFLILSDVRPGEGPAALIAAARTAAAQESSNFLFSSVMGGFFGCNYEEPVQQQQAEAIKARWQQLVSGAAAKCETIALAIGDDPSSTSMHANSLRIKGIKPEDAAAGAAIFKCPLFGDDLVTPYVAPVVQYDVSPGNTLPYFSTSLFDKEPRDHAPSSFVDGLVREVTFKGNLGIIAFQLFFCNDKAAALSAIEEDKSPILKSKDSALCVKFSKRTVGPEVIGTLVNEKVEMCLTEVLPFANMAIYAHIFPCEQGGSQLSGHWAEFGGVDFVDGIKKVGVAVSQKWLDTSMLGGRGVFIHTPTEGQCLLEPKVGCGPAPVLKTNGYQAISEGSFDFEGLRIADGKTLHFYVLYEKCSKDVESNAELNTSTDAGESHMVTVAISACEDGNLRDFLRSKCVVYAVAA